MNTCPPNGLEQTDVKFLTLTETQFFQKKKKVSVINITTKLSHRDKCPPNGLEQTDVKLLTLTQSFLISTLLQHDTE